MNEENTNLSSDSLQDRQKKDILTSAKQFFGTALSPLKGRDNNQLLEEFTNEMTLVAEGLSEDQERISRLLDNVTSQQTLFENDTEDRLRSLEASVQDNAKRLNDLGRLIGIDQDEDAVAAAGERLKEFSNVTYIRSNYCNMKQKLGEMAVGTVDGILLDLGVSSYQLDTPERGFSYMADAPLDMRMDTGDALTAYDVVNTWDENRLNRILWDYGEERYARKITGAILSHRERKPIETTLELVDIIRGAMPAAALREKQHPAKRTFQAIRIAVNDELGAVSTMMETVPDKLKIGGRLCVISFHSLEDRIVKSGIAARENGCTCPREAPICTCGFKQTLRSVSRKPILPSQEELAVNPRSRSAKLRVAERV